MKNEQKYPWLYDSVVHQGYLSKFCELFCGHSSSSQECVTVGITLVQYATSPLFALCTCCWMSFEAVLGNKELNWLFLE
jgi:transcription elongation factor Elf1